MNKKLKFKIKNHQKGFTLIELLIYMGIFSILIITIFQLLVAIFDVQLESQSTSAVSQDGRYIVNRLTYDIQNADAISTPLLGSESATLTLFRNETTFTYNLSNANLDITDSTLGATDQLNSANSSISDLTFLRLADVNNQNDTITVSFTINSVAQKRSGVASENFKTTIGIRQ